MPAECELPVRHNPCGILAVARCATCEQAMCDSHQAKTSANGLLHNSGVCISCQTSKEAGRSSKFEQKRQAMLRQERILHGGISRVAAQLVQAGSPEIQDATVGDLRRRRFTGVGPKHCKVRGWFVGTHQWHSGSRSNPGPFTLDTYVDEDGHLRPNGYGSVTDETITAIVEQLLDIASRNGISIDL